MKLLDMRGNPCPIPVLQAKKELAKPDVPGIAVVVDNYVAVQNLEKMAGGMGYTFSQDGADEDGCYRVLLGKEGIPAPLPRNESPAPLHPESEGLCVLISSDRLGDGDEDLGKMLLKGFLFALTELPTPPETVIFINAGVLLTTAGSNAVEDLTVLQSKGTRVCACGACLNFYGVTQQLAVGQVVDMYWITSCMASASKVIAP